MFFFILFFIVVIIETFILSSLKVEIKNLRLSTEKTKDKIINSEYKISISLWCLKKIKVFNIEIKEKEIKKLNIKEKIKENIDKITIKSIKNNRLEIETLKKVKKHLPKIIYVNIKAYIGTEDAIITSYIVAIISSILAIILKNQITIYNKSKYIINPVYINKNLLKLELDCILEVKLIHIIYIIYILFKKRRDDKNGRTSNRRTYGYSYE